MGRKRTQEETSQLALALEAPGTPAAAARRGRSGADLARALQTFNGFGKETLESATQVDTEDGRRFSVPTYTNEYWTARQRQANALHEVSYRACFKPQLPRFFIERLTTPGDVVYDPFMGRGTTLVEAALMGRVAWGNDVNPLSVVLTRPRLSPVTEAAVRERLAEVAWSDTGEMPEDLLVFYHPETLREISALRKYLLGRGARGGLDAVDDWIRMVAVNRLTGHSAGFFSVYTLPPNQATSVRAQAKINAKRNQVPPRRNVREIILKKTRQLLGECDEGVCAGLRALAARSRLTSQPAEATTELPPGCVDLVVTSPPFLNVVQYAADNWLRCWFVGVDAQAVPISVPASLEVWRELMRRVFAELERLLKPGGWVAFEVGEVRGGRTRLEESVVPCGVAAGLAVQCIMIQAQEFTKTANCWGVDNNAKGTNTNRIVVFRK